MFAPALGGWLEVWVGWRVGFLLLSAAGAVTPQSSFTRRPPKAARPIVP